MDVDNNERERCTIRTAQTVAPAVVESSSGPLLENSKRRAVATVITVQGLLADVRLGQTLADAMKTLPAVFPAPFQDISAAKEPGRRG